MENLGRLTGQHPEPENQTTRPQPYEPTPAGVGEGTRRLGTADDTGRAWGDSEAAGVTARDSRSRRAVSPRGLAPPRLPGGSAARSPTRHPAPGVSAHAADVSALSAAGGGTSDS